MVHCQDLVISNFCDIRFTACLMNFFLYCVICLYKIFGWWFDEYHCYYPLSLSIWGWALGSELASIFFFFFWLVWKLECWNIIACYFMIIFQRESFKKGINLWVFKKGTFEKCISKPNIPLLLFLLKPNSKYLLLFSLGLEESMAPVSCNFLKIPFLRNSRSSLVSPNCPSLNPCSIWAVHFPPFLDKTSSSPSHLIQCCESVYQGLPSDRSWSERNVENLTVFLKTHRKFVPLFLTWEVIFYCCRYDADVLNHLFNQSRATLLDKAAHILEISQNWLFNLPVK